MFMNDKIREARNEMKEIAAISDYLAHCLDYYLSSNSGKEDENEIETLYKKLKDHTNNLPENLFDS